MEKKNIAIAGAGLVGSLLACYMAKRGHNVNVYEGRPDMRKGGPGGGRSINLAISDRGFRALAGVGLEETVRKLCIPMKGRMMHSESGELTFQAYGLGDQAINSISRARLNMEMMDLAEEFDGVNFHFGHKCASVDEQKGLLYFEDESLQPVQADVIFGADGAFSAIRHSLQMQPRFNYCQDYLEHGYKELSIPADEHGGWRLQKYALHIWPRRSFMLIALPNLDGTFTVTLFAPFEGENSFDLLRDENAVRAFFEREFPDALSQMPELIEEFFTNPTSALVTVKCSPWARGRVGLIGDAAHAVVPFYGQGMNAGFEDCRILNEIIDRYPDSEKGDWQKILQSYSDARKVNGDAIADLAKINFVEMRDKVADSTFLLRKQILARVAERHPDGFTPVYSMVSFGHVPYSEALAELSRQNAAFDQILALPDVAEKWEHELMQQIEKILLPAGL